MEGTIGIIFILALIFLIWLSVSVFFLGWGASIAGIEKTSFGKLATVIILGGITFTILNVVLAGIPIIGQLFSAIGGFVVSSLIMMPICDTTFGKALVANLLSWVLSIIVIIFLIIVLLALGITVPVFFV